MRLTERNTEKLSLFALAILALAMAVFAWGLRSKLSLYHEAAPMAHAPVAKLLSNRERPADTMVQIEHATTPVITAVFVVWGLCAGLLLLNAPERQSLWNLQQAHNPQRRPVPQAAGKIFFRPPPSLR